MKLSRGLSNVKIIFANNFFNAKDFEFGLFPLKHPVVVSVGHVRKHVGAVFSLIEAAIKSHKLPFLFLGHRPELKNGFGQDFPSFFFGRPGFRVYSITAPRSLISIDSAARQHDGQLTRHDEHQYTGRRFPGSKTKPQKADSFPQLWQTPYSMRAGIAAQIPCDGMFR